MSRKKPKRKYSKHRKIIGGRKFGGKTYEFTGSGDKRNVQQWSKFVKARGDNYRIIKDNRSGLWLIYERKGRRRKK